MLGLLIILAGAQVRPIIIIIIIITIIIIIIIMSNNPCPISCFMYNNVL